MSNHLGPTFSATHLAELSNKHLSEARRFTVHVELHEKLYETKMIDRHGGCCLVMLTQQL